MKLRTRTQFILAVIAFFFLITLFIVANAFIQSAYTTIELRQSDANVQIVAEEIRYQTTDLGDKARDWAVWDDTYRFMEDNNSHFRQAVVESATTYESLDISGLILFDSDGNVIASQGYDLDNRTLTPLPEETIQIFAEETMDLSNTRGGKKRQGLVLLSTGPVLTGIHAVLRTNGMGFGHGTLVLIQPLDNQKIDSIKSRLRLLIRIWRLDSPATADMPDIASLTGPGAQPYISSIRDQDTATGLFLLSDISGKPALLVGVETPRKTSQQVTGTLMYLLGAVALLGIIFIVFTGIILNRTIISPLTDLNAAMKNIGTRRDLSERLPVEGDDEIALLRASFNTMLQELQDKEDELRLQGDLAAEANRKAHLYLDIYLDVLTYEILNVTISLQAYAELIRESGNSESREYADRIFLALNRNLTVIRNIETISKIYKNPPRQVPVDIRAVVEKEAEKFRTMQIRFPEPGVTVLADEMLGIVFYNLFLNCQKFGRDDLTVEVTTRELSDGMVEISVVDNGTGIADDMKPLIFDRFLKGSDKRSSYGLGLHIVKMLIEAYGGKVRADDRIPGSPDEGAAIRFTLQKG